MRYLITGKNFAPFFSDRFDSENHFNKEVEMIVYDLHLGLYTHDGINWNVINIDHL